MSGVRTGVAAAVPAAATGGDLRRVQDAMAAGRFDEALALGIPMLAAAPTVPLLCALAESAACAGAAGIGLWLVRAMRAAGPGDALAEIEAQLARLPSGEIPHAVLAARWATRRAALVACDARTVGALPAALPAEIAVIATRRGNALFLRRSTGEPRQPAVLAPFEDAVSVAERTALPAVQLGAATAFLGVPSEPLLSKALAQRSWLGYLPPIDIVEPDAWLAMAWVASLADGDALGSRVLVFAGDGAAQRYGDMLAAHPWRLAPTARATIRRAGRAPVALPADFDAEVARRRLERERAEVAEIAARDRAHGRIEACRRLAGRDDGGPLRFVGFTSRHSTFVRQSMERLAAAFRRRGCAFDVVDEPQPWAARVDVIGTLQRQRYDAVFLINHLRAEYGDALREGPPCVSWIQDYMPALFTRTAGASVGPLDLVLCHEPDEMAALHGYPESRCIPTTNLGDAEQYAEAKLPDDELAQHRCDVSFASHASESPRELVEIATGGDLAPMRALLHAALDDIEQRVARDRAIAPHALVEIMLAAERRTGSGPCDPSFRRAHLFPEVTRLYDRVLRHETAHWTARWAQARGRTFHLHGHGWERQGALAPYARGPIEAGRPLRALYQASSVVLQANGHMSLHQRLIDGLLSGGCVVSRWNPNDFRRASAKALSEALRASGVQSLRALDEARGTSAELDALCRACERDFGLAIRAAGHPLRDAQVAATRAGNDLPGLADDEGFLRTLREMRYVPRRSACDLPGFAASCFSTEAELHRLLDALVDDPAARHALAAPMRAAVAAHDTCDVLAGRILDSLRLIAGSAT